MSASYWEQVISDGLTVPSDRPLDDLTAELTRMLGSTDPDERDGTAYPTLATWIRRGRLRRPAAPGSATAWRRACGSAWAGPRTTASSAAAFSVLVLAECIAPRQRPRPAPGGTRSSSGGTGSRPGTCASGTCAASSPGKGWAHAVAHGADAIGALAGSPHFVAPELTVLLDVLADRVLLPVDGVFCHGELDRMARATMAVLRRDVLPLAVLEPWVRLPPRPPRRRSGPSRPRTATRTRRDPGTTPAWTHRGPRSRAATPRPSCAPSTSSSRWPGPRRTSAPTCCWSWSTRCGRRTGTTWPALTAAGYHWVACRHERSRDLRHSRHHGWGRRGQRAARRPPRRARRRARRRGRPRARRRDHVHPLRRARLPDVRRRGQGRPADAPARRAPRADRGVRRRGDRQADPGPGAGRADRRPGRHQRGQRDRAGAVRRLADGGRRRPGARRTGGAAAASRSSTSPRSSPRSPSRPARCATAGDVLAGWTRPSRPPGSSHRGPVFVDVPMDEFFGPHPARPRGRAPPRGASRTATRSPRSRACSPRRRRPVLILGTDVWADGAEEAALRLRRGAPASRPSPTAWGAGRPRRPPAAGHQGPRLGARQGATSSSWSGTPLDFRLGYGVFGGKDGATPARSCTSPTPPARSPATPRSPRPCPAT